MLWFWVNARIRHTLLPIPAEPSKHEAMCHSQWPHLITPKGTMMSFVILPGQLLLSSLGQTHKLMQLSSLAPIALKGRGRRRYLPQHPDDERLFSSFVCTQEAPVRLTQVCGCSGPRCSAGSSCPAIGLLVTLQLYVPAHLISTRVRSYMPAQVVVP